MIAGLLKGGGYFREAWQEGVAQLFAPALDYIETAKTILPAAVVIKIPFGMVEKARDRLSAGPDTLLI